MTVEKVLIVGLRKIKDQFWATDDSGSGHFPTHFHPDAEDTSFWFGHRNEIIGLMVSRFPPAGPTVRAFALRPRSFGAPAMWRWGLTAWRGQANPATVPPIRSG